MYLLTCARNDDLNQPAHPRSMSRVCCHQEETLHPWLSKLRPVKILIRLRECAVWSESSLGADIQRYVFWCCDPYKRRYSENAFRSTTFSSHQKKERWENYIDKTVTWTHRHTNKEKLQQKTHFRLTSFLSSYRIRSVSVEVFRIITFTTIVWFICNYILIIIAKC